MSGGLSFLNHCLAIPVFVIPPNGILNLLPDQTSDEWRSLFGFSVGFGDGGGRYKKNYLHRLDSFMRCSNTIHIPPVSPCSRRTLHLYD